MQTIKASLQKCIKDIDSGSCDTNNPNDNKEFQEALEVLQTLMRKDIPMSKYQAYNYLGVSRATFDNYVRDGKIPLGQKMLGFKELSWLRKDLDKFIKECRKK